MSEARETITLRAKPGPQTDFLACEADLAFFGGKAGGGKTWTVCFDALHHVHLPGWNAAFFRYDKERFDALWSEMEKLFPYRGGIGAKSDLRWRFPSGARVQCFGLRGLDVDREKHRGPRYACVYFEEVTEISERDFWFIVGRNGTTVPGFRAYVRCTCNPQAVGWVRTLLSWWIGDDGYPIRERCGRLRWFVRTENDRFEWADSREELLARFPGSSPLSLTFIPTYDLVEELDETYRAKLRALPRIDRIPLERGNWNVREQKGSFFKRDDFKTAPRFVESVMGKPVRILRAWDLAASEPTRDDPEPDWTRGVRLVWTDRQNLVIADMASFQKGPGDVEALVLRTAQRDNEHVAYEALHARRALETEVVIPQDPAQAGKYQADAFTRRLSGFVVHTVPARADKVTLAKVWAPWCEQGRVFVIEGAWNDEFFTEAEDFPFGKKDQIDAVSHGVVVLTGRMPMRSVTVRGA